jgi:transcriptional regulator with XRE-family HTH domain
MTQMTNLNRTIHQGRNVKRFREMLGIKQEALAFELGDDWNQKKISLLESKEIIEPALLQQLSGALKIPVEAFENFDEEQAVNVIANTFNEKSFENAFANNCTFNFNPVEKMVELYERIIQQQKEMIEKLERLMEKK